MKNFTLFTLAILALSPMALEAASRTRDVAKRMTSDLLVSQVENLIQTGAGETYAAEKIEALKNEIMSCGLTYNGTPCLDSKFENFGNAGVKDVDTTDKSGYVFFSRFKMKGDSRILLMSIIANKSDCVLDQKDPKKCAIDPRTKRPVALRAFRTGNIWAVGAGREKPEAYVKDFLECTTSEVNCKLLPILAFDPIEGIADRALVNEIKAIGGIRGKDFRRLHHLAAKASSIKDAALVKELSEALVSRAEIVTGSGNALYTAAFFQLVQTKYSKDVALVTTVARQILALNPAGSVEAVKAAMVLAANGEKTPEILGAIKAGILNARLDATVRSEAVTSFAAAATLAEDKSFIVSLLGSSDAKLRGAAFGVIGNLELAEENLPAVEKLLKNSAVNIRGNGLRALARVSGVKALELMTSMIGDADMDVATDAAKNMKMMAEAITVIPELSLVNLIEVSEVKARVTDARDQRLLDQNLIPSRDEALKILLTKTEGDEISVLTRLKAQATSKKSPSVRARTVALISLMEAPESISVLIGLLADVDAQVSTAVLKGLGLKTLTDEHTDVVFKVSLNKVSAVRRNAVAALAMIPTKRAREALVQKSRERIDNDSQTIRADVARILGSHFTQDATLALIDLIGDESVMVVNAASKELERADRLLGRAELERLVSKNEASDAAFYAVTRIGQNLVKDPAIEIFFRELAETSVSERTVTLALRILAGTSAEANTETLSKVLLQSNPALRLLAVTELGKLASPRNAGILRAHLEVEVDEIIRSEIQRILGLVSPVEN